MPTPSYVYVFGKYGEKSNQPKRFLFPKGDYGKIFVMHALALSRSNIHKSYQVYWKNGCSGKTGAFCKDKSTIKMLRWVIICQGVTVMPDVGNELLQQIILTIQIAQASERHLTESIYWKLPRMYDIKLHQDDPYKKMVMRLTAILPSLPVVLRGNHMMIQRYSIQLQQHKISIHIPDPPTQ